MTDRDPRDVVLDVFARMGFIFVGRSRRGDHFLTVDDTVFLTDEERAALDTAFLHRIEPAVERTV